MELRQLRYFVRSVEWGSMGRAALDLEMAQSALSQQVSRLEGELSTRLLRRTSRGVVATEAGVAFFREAQLTLRHADQAVRVARQARLSGTVSVGLAPTTAAMLGLPLMRAMRERYPDVRLHLVEGLSGHLAAMLNSKTLDMAILFDRRTPAGPGEPGRRLWQIQPLMDEDIFLICARERCMRPGKIPSTPTLNDIARGRWYWPPGPMGCPTPPMGLLPDPGASPTWFSRSIHCPCSWPLSMPAWAAHFSRAQPSVVFPMPISAFSGPGSTKMKCAAPIPCAAFPRQNCLRLRSRHGW